jgi:transposase
MFNMSYIAGASREQITLFPDSIDEYIEEENAVRVIDIYVERLDLRELSFTKSETKETGRPPYSPKDMLKLYIYGYMNRIRSSRQLEKETKRNVEVMWLIKKLTPDHKTIARFRSENANALKRVFRDFVKLCLKIGLYGKELAAIDGSKFKAVNSKDRNLSLKELNERIKRLTARIDEYMKQMNETDKEEDEQASQSDIKKIIEKLSGRLNTYEAYRDEMETDGETQKSLTDSEARLMKDAKGFDVSYNVQTSVDSKNKLIAEFNVTNEGNDMKQLAVMATATANILEEPKLTVTADTGYNSASEIANCVQSGINPQVIGSECSFCVPCDAHDSQEIVSHEKGRSVYIKERNIVICPMGQVLHPMYYMNVDRTARYYNYSACANCTCKCTKTKYQVFGIRMKKSEFNKEFNDSDLYFKQIVIKPDLKITCQRKELAEHPFGTIKRAMDAGYLLTKGLSKVTGEFSLVFLAYNLKRVINIMGVKNLIDAMM